MKTSEIKKILNADSITQRNGIIIWSKPYYYRHGQSLEKMVDRVKTAFPDANIVDTDDKFGNKYSKFIVKFVIPK